MLWFPLLGSDKGPGSQIQCMLSIPDLGPWISGSSKSLGYHFSDILANDLSSIYHVVFLAKMFNAF